MLIPSSGLPRQEDEARKGGLILTHQQIKIPSIKRNFLEGGSVDFGSWKLPKLLRSSTPRELISSPLTSNSLEDSANCKAFHALKL